MPMDKLTFGSLFAGIGGFDLGFERAGMECKWQVEIDDYANKVLAKHWPKVRRWGDVRTWPQPDSEMVDVICGGFPCQDISVAGFGEGLNGKRSGLWSEYKRTISCIRPSYVVVENVSALLIRGMGTVLWDLADLGYDAEWQSLRASDFGLPHRRERVFIVAYSHSIIRSKREGMGIKPVRKAEVFRADGKERSSVRVQAYDSFIGMDDGLSRKLYGPRAERIGNAIVPDVAEWIGKLIMEHFYGD